MRRVLQVIGLLGLLIVALTAALFARLRGRQSRFERARIERVEDAVTPLQRELFAHGCSSVRVLPIAQAMQAGPHAPRALWLECWSEESCEAQLERLPWPTWPPESTVQLNAPGGSWCSYRLQGGRADQVGGSSFSSPHMRLDRRPLSRRLAAIVGALFQ